MSIRTLIKKECLDHLLSRRFMLTSLLSILLFVASSFSFLEKYQQDLNDYQDQVSLNQRAVSEAAETNVSTLYNHKQRLFIKPCKFSFIASQGAKYLPNSAELSPTSFYMHPMKNLRRTNILLSRFLDINWSFTISIVLSFLVFLLSYNAISGEKENGTLPVLMSNSVKRFQVILSKFCGILLATIILLILGITLSLLIIFISGQIVWSIEDLGIIALAFILSITYLTLFTFIGLMVSSLSSRSSVSLVVLLLIWVMFVFIIPASGRLIAATVQPIEDILVFRERSDRAIEDIMDRYQKEDKDTRFWGGPSKEFALQSKYWVDMENEMTSMSEKMNWERIQSMFHQTELARSVSRFSPSSTFDLAMEAIAGTGFTNVKRFIQELEKYQEVLREFLLAEDSKDEDSAHVPWWYFLSKMSLDPTSVPRFQMTPPGLSTRIQEVLIDWGILTFLSGVFFVLGSVAFLKYDVR